MRTTIGGIALGIAASLGVAAWLGGRPAPSQERLSIAALAARAAALERDIALLEDVNAIKKLQRIYGFYTDKQLWSEAADLFSADGTIEVGGRGVYVGPERIREFLRLHGPETPQPKRLFDHMQLQPIVHVAADGLTAQGRWHVFAQEAVHGEYANWGLGVLENEYVKEGGVWKIRRHHFFTTMYTPYEAGWGKTAIPNAGPSADLPPDRPPSVDYEAYPTAFVVPFHYENPVTSATPSVRERRRRRGRCRRRRVARSDARGARPPRRLARGRGAARAPELDLRLLPRASAVGRSHGDLLADRHASRSRCAASTSARRACAAT